MEEESKDHSNKKPSQVFIITPEELAKLGILDSLTTKLKTNNKAKDQDSSVATTSATKTKPVFKNETEQLLLNIFKQKKVCNSKDDNEVFKKPGPSKFKDIKDTATITTLSETNVGEIITKDSLKASKNATETISDTSNLPIILNKSTTEFRKANTLNKTNKLKQINIISNTLSNFDTDEINKIVGQTNSTIIKTALVNNPKKSTFGRQKLSTSEIECSDKNKEDKQEFMTNISGDLDSSTPGKEKSKKRIVILEDIKISKQGELEIGVDLNNIPLIFGSNIHYNRKTQNETSTSSHSSSEDLEKRELKRYSNNVRSQESETLEKTQVGIDTSMILDSILINTNKHLVNIPKSDLEDSLKEITSKVTEPTVNEKCDVATKLADVLVSTSEKVEHSKKSIRELEELHLHQISDTSDSIKTVENTSEEKLNDSEFIYTNINTPPKKLSESNPISKQQHTSKNVSETVVNETDGSTNLENLLSSTISGDEANKTAENNLKETLNDSESIRSNIDSTVHVDISDQSNVSYISNKSSRSKKISETLIKNELQDSKIIKLFECKSIKLRENLDKTVVDLNSENRVIPLTVVNDEANNSYKFETEIEMNSTRKYTQTIIDIPKKRGRRKKVSQNQSIDLIQNINVSSTDLSNPVQIITVRSPNVSESVIGTETDQKVSDPEVKSCFELDENSTKINVQNIHQISPLHYITQKEQDLVKKMSDHEEDPIHKYQKRLEKQVTLKDDDDISHPSSEETLLNEKIKSSKKVSDDSIKIIDKEDSIHKPQKRLEKQETLKYDDAISNLLSEETSLSEEIKTTKNVTDDYIKIIDKVDPIDKHHKIIKKQVSLKDATTKSSFDESLNEATKKTKKMPEDSINMVNKEDENRVVKQETLKDDTEDVTSNVDQKNKNVVQETSILVEESEQPEIDGMDNLKSEVSLTEHEEIKRGVVELRMEQESKTNLENTDEPFKKKRGRPRKSLSIGQSEDSINMVDKEDQNRVVKQETLKDDTEDVTSNEDDDAPINKKKVTDLKRRYRIPWRNKRMEIDQKNKKIVQETTNILVEESEQPEIDGMDDRKSEVSLTEHEEINQGVVELRMEQESKTNLENADHTFKKKRGRPRKSLSIGRSEDSINMVDKEDLNRVVKQETLKDDSEDVTSNDDDDAPINKKKVIDLKRRYRIPWRNKRMEIDQKNKKIVQETINILVEESEQPEIDGMDDRKSEVSLTEHEEINQGVVELRMEQELKTNLENADHPFKKKRGRPRKSLSIGRSEDSINMVDKEDLNRVVKQETLKDDSEDVTSNDDDDTPINKKKVTDLKRRYRIPWRNKRMEIDQKNTKIVQETTNILVVESEQPEIGGMDNRKSEVSLTENEEIKQEVVELRMEQESKTNLENTDQPFKKKRGRPRKSLSTGTSIQNIESNIKENISTDNTPATTQSEEAASFINTPSENTEPPSKRKRGRKSKGEKVENCALLPDKKIVLAIEESNRGRKRAKINYLELEENNTFSEEIQNAFNTSANEKNTTDITLNALDTVPKKKRGRPRKSETISYSEGKSEVAVVREDVESDTSETPPRITRGTPRRSISVEPFVEEESDVLINKETKSNLEEPLDNPMIISDNSGLPLKKKVGRPRKNILESVPPVSEEEIKEGSGKINTVDENLNATPSTSFESPESVIKKKGGRKSIGEQQSKNIPEEETVKPMKESKRGRKHVIIDYLQIEGQLAEEIQPSKKTKQFSSNNDEFKPKVKVETFTEASEMPIEKSKYTYTGQYTKLMSDVFSAAIKSDNAEAKPNTNITKSRGRSKKNAENVFNIDEEGNVTCSSCKVKVDISEWNNHNETEHNNLAWRDGEPVVTLDHQATIEKLKHLHKKNKSLICLNCNNKYTKLKEFISHSEECLGIVVNGDVTCASCNKTMPRTLWSHHKLKHNNLCWRVGEHPLDLSNETFVIQTLNALYKAKKPLYCDKCEMVKKSVVGLLSHMSQCGDNVENAKISCEICGKRMLPVSLPTHIKFVHETPKKVALESSYFEIDLETSQKRRKAATKAIAKMDELSSDKLEIFRHFVKQINFDDDKTLIMFLNQELEDTKILKCKIKGCEFSCEETSILLSHLSSCPLKPDQHYTCKTCFLIEPSEEDIINHIELTHNIKIKQEADYVYNENDYKAGDDVIPEDELKLERKLKRKSNVKSSLISEPKQRPLFVNEFSRWQKHPNNLFSHAFKFTFEFCEKHFRDEFLFGDLKCEESHWNLIDEIYLDKYLPQSEFSCDVVIQNVKRMCNVYNDEYNFKNYELFQIEQTDVNITIYCGGPVRCLAWLPTPHTSLDQTQILAVSTSKDFDEKYYHLENYTESTVIQFWNFGVLKNCQTQPEPKLEFCLGVDNGPVWHMEWCPSGCYNVNESDEWSRRGLLAVAGSSMPVHIYSIPFFKEEHRELFYTARPILKLQLVTDENNLKRKIFATKLSWSKVSGHSYIAVGYSDGTVAMYNLDATSNLLRFTDDLSLDVLLPYKIIKNHSHYISALSLVPIGDGNRLLLTSSFDKAIHIWDLQNDDKFFVKKGKVLADGAWLTNWLSFVTASDESTAIGHAVAAVSSHREYLYDWCNLSFSTSTISSISASDWLNGFVHGNDTGEINAFFPHQLIYEMGKLKRKNDYRFLTGFAKLIDKTMTPAERSAVEDKKRDIIKYTTRRTRSSNAENKDESEAYKWYEPFEYKGATEKYGVVFSDTNELYKEPSVHAESEWPKSNLYPLVAINKISFNPNRQASLYYATGYQNGFVRLSYLKFLEKDQQIKVSESI